MTEPELTITEAVLAAVYGPIIGYSVAIILIVVTVLVAAQ